MTALLLHDQHQRVERLCLGLLDASHVHHPAALEAAWEQVEAELLDHLAAIEEMVLPVYERVEPLDARALRACNLRIIDRINHVGLEIQLRGRLRHETVRALIAALHAHAAEEEACLSGWVDDHMPFPARAAIAARLQRWERQN